MYICCWFAIWITAHVLRLVFLLFLFPYGIVIIDMDLWVVIKLDIIMKMGYWFIEKLGFKLLTDLELQVDRIIGFWAHASFTNKCE